MIPLSLSQREIYFDQLHHAGSSLYNVGGYIRMDQINVERLRIAHKILVERHEAFGLRIIDDAGEIGQEISARRTLNLPEVDFSKSADPRAEASAWITELFEQPIDFLNKELFRAFLLKISSACYWYLGYSHHLAIDGFGFFRWAKTLADIYNGNPFEPETVRLADLVDSDQTYVNSEKYKSDQNYWLQQFSKFPKKLFFPNYLNKNFLETRSRRLTISFSKEKQRFLESASMKASVEVQHILLTVLAIYFSLAYSNSRLVIGVPVHNRSNRGQRKKIGLYISVMPLIIEVDKTLSVADLARKIAYLQRTNMRHRRYPLGDIYRDLKLDSTNQKFYDIGYSYLPVENSLQFDSGVAEMVYCSHNHEQTPLLFSFWNSGSSGNVGLHIDYNLAYFNDKEIQLLQARLQTCIDQISTDVGQIPASISILPEKEKLWLLKHNNEFRLNLKSTNNLVELFHQQVEKTPHKTAAIYGKKNVSYSKLNDRANRLAHYLRDGLVAPNEIVGIYLERSIDLVICLLACWKANAAYLPLDTKHPKARLSNIIKDSGTKLIVTEKKLLSTFKDIKNNTNELIYIDLKEANVIDGIAKQKFDNPNFEYHLNNALAYVIYTSGSTGEPKGVAVGNYAVANFIQGFLQRIQLPSGVPWLFLSSISFDIALVEWFGCLVNGNSCVIVNEKQALDPFELKALLEQQPVDYLQATPSRWQQLLDSGWQGSKSMVGLCCGEALTLTLQERITGLGITLWNGYGPTEATVYSLLNKIDPKSSPHRRLGLGKSMPNYQHYVIASNGELAPLGVPGELAIAGPGLAYGYLNRDYLTHERFVPSSFVHESGDGTQYLYRTGDLVRYLSDGTLEYIGRNDFQVKVRGLRIELLEIDVALNEIDDIKDSVTIARHNVATDSLQLISYIIANESSPIAQNGASSQSIIAFKQQISTRLAQKLPEYMVPNTLVLISAFPLSLSGKLDRDRLPEPSIETDTDFDAIPTTPTELALARIWARLLSIPEQSLHKQSSFFASGGDSLIAVKLANVIMTEMKKKLSLQDIFSQKNLQGLAGILDSLPTTSPEYFTIAPSTTIDKTPTSFAQQRLWFIDRLERGSSHYNMSVAYKVRGKLETDTVEISLQHIVARHKPLHSVFLPEDKGLYQTILYDHKFTLVRNDFIHLSSKEKTAAISNAVVCNSEYIFDLANELPLRVQCIRLTAYEHLLLFNIHHIVADGGSVQVLLKEFVTYYRATTNSEAVNLQPLRIQYGDYAQWEMEILKQSHYHQKLERYASRLQNLPELHQLPLDYSRPSVQNYIGDCYRQSLDDDLMTRLETLSTQHEATQFMLMLAAFSLWLSRWSNNEDVVVGTPVSGRHNIDLEPLVGLFVNELVFRQNLHADMNFNSLLAQTKSLLMESFSAQAIPFEKLVDKLRPTRNLSYNTLFQIMFTLEHENRDGFDIPGLNFERLEEELIKTKFDLELVVRKDTTGSWHCDWVYATSQFSRATIARMADSFVELLKGIEAKPTQPIYQLPILCLNDQKKLAIWNQTQFPFPSHWCCIHELFQDKVESHPHKIALKYGTQTLNYIQLNKAANQIAHCLLEKGVSPGDKIGICIERSLTMVIGILAVLKAGGAYVPMDPLYPSGRLRHIFSDGGLTFILTHTTLISHLTTELQIKKEQLLCLDDEQYFSTYCTNNVCRDAIGLKTQDLAYIIYTSGSTGKPKGVQICHDNTIALLNWAGRTFAPTELQRVLASTSLNFDLSVFELFVPLCFGFTCVIVDDILAFADEVLNRNSNVDVTLINTVPSAAKMLLNQQSFPSNVQVINLAGEPLKKELVNQLLEHNYCKRVCNLYGPSEDTTYSTWSSFDTYLSDAPPIGRPVDNTVVYVLSGTGTQVPIGVIGELYLGGAGVAKGYQNQPDLTKEKFIRLSLPDKPAQRVYRTGDLVRYLPNGELVYIGRIDNQVKIRGYRIELGEIEAHLSNYLGIKESLVKAFSQSSDNISDNLTISSDLQLVAYIVVDDDIQKGCFRETVNNDANLAAEEDWIQLIKIHLQSFLPHYMIPTRYIFLMEFPLTLNGKIDHQALPTPNELSLPKSAYIPPRNHIEKTLCNIWKKILMLEKVGVEDNFFDLGGNSMKLINVGFSIKEYFHIEIALSDLYKLDNIRSLGAKITRLVESDNSEKKVSYDI